MAGTASPFAVGPQLAKLKGAYPSARDVLEAVSEGRRATEVLARLWISEGIPFAFKNCPAIYEEFRAALAERLELDAKQISVAGSGRLGYSLAPSKWGSPYRAESSDLDMFAVSDDLFRRLCEDFTRWRADYAEGRIQPPASVDRTNWDNNRDETPGTIRRGFIDSMRVPNETRYGGFLTLNRCLEHRWDILQATDETLSCQSCPTLRCYRDWGAYEQQLVISLQKVFEERSNGIPGSCPV
ncbi:MAG: hypothetical protein OXQ29_14940 [Rhodospirillaceae bacterium]|nr:hypothetical protein [Rhodospirillaceae bacterium]